MKIFLNKQKTYLMQKNMMCREQIRIYSKHVVQRANFVNVETDFNNAEKWIRLLRNSNMKKRLDLTFRFRKHDFTSCFMRKQGRIF